LSQNGRFCRVMTLLGVCSIVSAAHPTTSPNETFNPWPQMGTEAPASWLSELWNLPLFHWLVPSDSEIAVVPPAPVPLLPACPVEPLAAIDDTDAQTFETSNIEGGRVDLSGLTPATARALNRFEMVVGHAGGSLEVKSAFRPPAYQQHLQNVWDKWRELQLHPESACQDLKAQVEAEFTGHALLWSQRPVPISDHTLGIGFDAAVILPFRVKTRRLRLTIDALARRAGVMRPDIFRDPVHFRLIGGRLIGS
jgi:hypothetical protein